MPDFSSENRHRISKDEIRQQLPHLHPPLRLLGEDWLAASTTIDFVTLDPEGDVTLLLVGEAGEDPALLTQALAHRSWVAARLENWRQLAPDAGIATHAQVRAVLLCPSFAPETLAAAESLGGAIVPVRCRGIKSKGEFHAVFESLGDSPPERPEHRSTGRAPEGPPAARAPAVPPAARAPEAPPAARTPAVSPAARAPESPPRGKPRRFRTLPFRSGLTEEDLDLTPEEAQEFS